MEKTNILKESLRETSKKKYYSEIDIAKGIGIILVVLGHSLVFFRSQSVLEKSRIIQDLIFCFHMPLFFILSGILNRKILRGEKQKDIIISKIKRLLVPYFTIGVFLALIEKAIEIYLYQKSDVNIFPRILLGINRFYELWFLWVLFIVLTIATLFARKKSIIVIIVVSILVSILFSEVIIDKDSYLIAVMKLLRNSCYVFIGLWAGQNYEKVEGIILKYKKIIWIPSLILFVGAFCMLENYKSRIPNNLFCFITAITGSILVIWISLIIKNIKLGNGLRALGTYSMDIYVLSAIIQPVIRKVFVYKFNMNYVVYIISSTVAVLVITVLLSKFIIRKIKWLRRLVLGMD